MINTATMFVLGAGAHCPYGLPDGTTLTRDIVELLPTKPRHNNPFHDVFFALYNSQFGSIDQLLIDFRFRLEHAGHAIIDSFLKTHAKRKGFAEIGKLAVAYLLLPNEFKMNCSRNVRYSVQNPDQDWMSYLFTKMLNGSDESVDQFLNRNKVSFVTFNYDRTLEQFLCARLASTFDLTKEQAWEKAEAIEIVHVYGSLGHFDPSLMHRKVGPNIVTEFRQAADSIRLMYEDRAEEGPVAHAKTLLKDAQRICFLGFSFDPDNIDRLELNKTCAGKTLGATRYNVADGDWARAMAKLHPVQINITGKRDWDSRLFLCETTIF